MWPSRELPVRQRLNCGLRNGRHLKPWHEPEGGLRPAAVTFHDVSLVGLQPPQRSWRGHRFSCHFESDRGERTLTTLSSHPSLGFGAGGGSRLPGVSVREFPGLLFPCPHEDISDSGKMAAILPDFDLVQLARATEGLTVF